MKRPHLAAAALASLATLAATSLAARDARAIERQHHFGLDPSLSMLKVEDKSSLSVGVGMGAHYTYGLSDQFNFLAAVNASVVAADEKRDTPTTPRTRPSTIGHALVGIGYVIDVLRWVPYFGLLAGGYHLSGGTLDGGILVGGVAGEVGLEYQLSRRWAIGLAGQQHLLLTRASTYPSYTTVMFRLEMMWGY